MRKVDGHALLSALNALASLDKVASMDPESFYNTERTNLMVFMLNQLISQLEILDARLTLNKAKNMVLIIETLPRSYAAQAQAQTTSQALDELRNRLTEELMDRALYHIPPQKAQRIADGAQSFGQDVVNRFPHMKTDLGEAAACLGLSRNTACVFHLMRAVETAVSAIGDKLGATIVDKDNVGLAWGSIIANVNGEIEKMDRGPAKDKWSEIASHLFHVKNCWRNTTMHPKQTYTEEETNEVFAAVKSFLRNLAHLLST